LINYNESDSEEETKFDKYREKYNILADREDIDVNTAQKLIESDIKINVKPTPNMKWSDDRYPTY
jgi:hypothetical protein